MYVSYEFKVTYVFDIITFSFKQPYASIVIIIKSDTAPPIFVLTSSPFLHVAKEDDKK